MQCRSHFGADALLVRMMSSLEGDDLSPRSHSVHAASADCRMEGDELSPRSPASLDLDNAFDRAWAHSEHGDNLLYGGHVSSESVREDQVLQEAVEDRAGDIAVEQHTQHSPVGQDGSELKGTTPDTHGEAGAAGPGTEEDLADKGSELDSTAPGCRLDKDPSFHVVSDEGDAQHEAMGSLKRRNWELSSSSSSGVTAAMRARTRRWHRQAGAKGMPKLGHQ